MKYLIIGGTKFLGRHIIKAALKREHEVTIFTRGRQRIELDSRIEQLTGDRNSDLESLKGRTWDRVIDTCGYTPWEVESTTKLLAQSCDHYTFISSISVYADLEKPKVNEKTKVETISEVELQKIKDGEIKDAIMMHYGALKYLCEEAAKKEMPDRILNVRPGLIVGEFDPTDRFTYWVNRIFRGGEVLCPGRKDALVQLIDAEDLAQWIIKASEKAIVGEFNATGPDYNLTMEALLEKCKDVSKSNATLTWASEEFLLKNNVQYWSEMPLWIPESINSPGFLDADIRKAIEEGLKFKPLEATILDTLSYAKTREETYSYKSGISNEREKELIKLWHER